MASKTMNIGSTTSGQDVKTIITGNNSDTETLQVKGAGVGIATQTSSDEVVLVYDTTNKCLNFVFR